MTWAEDKFAEHIAGLPKPRTDLTELEAQRRTAAFERLKKYYEGEEKLWDEYTANEERPHSHRAGDNE